jgi:N-methylhydantoinase B
VSLSGGSGFGDPRTRPLAAVAHDLAEGFITPEAAERDYAVAVGRDGKLDMTASEKRRRLGTAAE